MFQILFFIAIVLLIAFIIVLIAVGLCIGIAYLMIYFIPTIELVNALVPASILTTVLIVIIGNVFKFWATEHAQNARIPLSDDDDYEDDDDEPEPPPVTTIQSYRNKRNSRWK
jgi:energy-coupling factor transporter transmembrane protein EcfT